MRSSRAGLFFLLLLFLSSAAAPAFGQASGFVESIGFERAYRPDAWVPMVVNLKSTLSEPAEYLIQVVQPDMDGDTVLYSRLVTLNANAPNDRYWVYFRPMPSGLDGGSPAELQRQLQVRLLTRDGKHLALLPIPPSTLIDIDPRSGFTARRGRKLVLAVIVPGGSSPAWAEYDSQNVLGINEDVDFINVEARDLPENAVGYGMVDAIVWFDARASDLSTGGSRKLEAMREWVRIGGRLVVCQPEEPDRIEPFADMLPVQLKDADGKWLLESINRADPEPLHTIATEPLGALDLRQRGMSTDLWHLLPKPFRVTRAVARTDAFVEAWVDWTEAEGGGRSPYIARSAFGLGSVTWVAQDLGAPTVARRFSSGWPHVWDRVFGWKNKTTLIKVDGPQDRAPVWGATADQWNAQSVADLGGSLLNGMDHSGKAGAYVFLVILFFIGYWIVAGPGSYLFLAGKGQRQLSWPIFAVSALAATLLTVLVVRLLLRGEPEVRHVTAVRLAPGAPAVVESRVGLYIPRDGPQEVALRDVDPDSVSTITALAIHPQHLGSYTGFPDSLDYRVDVNDVSGTGGVSVSLPYRSTLKKLQVHWVGNLPGGAGIVGDPELIEAGSVGDINGDRRLDGYIGGRVANKTGHDLRNVFFAFTYEAPGVPANDYMFYVPVWKKDETLDLLRTYAGAELLIGDEKFDKLMKGTSGVITGFLQDQWGPNLLRHVKSVTTSEGIVDDSRAPVRASFVLMSLYDRIPPMKSDRNQAYTRSELLRRGARELDMSQLLAAGNLVIIAETDDAPLPYPMEVAGDRMQGQGRVLYQATLPLRNRTKLAEPPPPETQPAAPAPEAAPTQVAEPPVEAPGA